MIKESEKVVKVYTATNKIYDKYIDLLRNASKPGYIQLTSNEYKEMLEEFTTDINEFHKEFSDLGKENGLMGRYLSDVNSPLYCVYMVLFYETDTTTYKWYEQPYHKNHPNEYNYVCLNKENK